MNTSPYFSKSAMRAIRIFLLILIIIGIGLLLTQNIWVPKLTDYILRNDAMQTVVVSSADYKNATYSVEGKSVTLVDGRSSIPAAPGSASMITTQYFGNNAVGDLNGDGVSDVGFILTQNNTGSGTFYYAVVALKTATGYRGTNAILLGDRIAPQTTEIKNGQLIVSYAERKPGEPMTTRPSIGVSKYFKVNGTTLTGTN